VTQEFFNEQVERLRRRFGANAFDSEFTRIVAKEVNHMADADLVELVTFLIGSRPPNRPPLIADIRDARLAIEKHSFNRDVAGATKILRHPEVCKPITELLDDELMRKRLQILKKKNAPDGVA
jgi:hypothetical protein